MQAAQEVQPTAERKPVNHVVKSHSMYFALAASGMKDWELRLNDRDYRVGDTMEMHEWAPSPAQFAGWEYTGASIKPRRIKLVMSPPFGLQPGYVILSLCGPIIIENRP